MTARYVLVEIADAEAPNVDWDGSVRLALLEEPWFQEHGVRAADVTDLVDGLDHAKIVRVMVERLS